MVAGSGIGSVGGGSKTTVLMSAPSKLILKSIGSSGSARALNDHNSPMPVPKMSADKNPLSVVSKLNEPPACGISKTTSVAFHSPLRSMCSGKRYLLSHCVCPNPEYIATTRLPPGIPIVSIESALQFTHKPSTAANNKSKYRVRAIRFDIKATRSDSFMGTSHSKTRLGQRSPLKACDRKRGAPPKSCLHDEYQSSNTETKGLTNSDGLARNQRCPELSKVLPSGIAPAGLSPKINVRRIRRSSVPWSTPKRFLVSWVVSSPEHAYARVTCQPQRA
jgi:hypothetical protein